SGAVGQQNHHGGNAPSHTQHGERGAAAVVLESAVGLAEEIASHRASSLCSGCRKRELIPPATPPPESSMRLCGPDTSRRLCRKPPTRQWRWRRRSALVAA